MPKYLTIVDGELAQIEAPEPMPLELMQKIVGGYVENPQRGASPDRYGYTIDLWCNDNRHGLQPNIYSHRLAEVIYGPVLIAAATPDGETVGLSQAEAETVLVFHWWHRAQVPVMDLRHREPANV
jgi:hypothetical protein